MPRPRATFRLNWTLAVTVEATEPAHPPDVSATFLVQLKRAAANSNCDPPSEAGSVAGVRKSAIFTLFRIRPR